jgi:hypothetical protein
MTAICRLTRQDFETSEFEREYCGKHDLPLPVTCPAERMRTLCAFRPAHYLFPTECSRSKQRILSCFPPDRGLTVYDVDAWLSDGWDARDYGRPYDFSRSFFDQFEELLAVVPLPGTSATHASLENSDYCNGVTGAKNCYLVFSGTQIDDCLYGRFLYRSRDLLDCFYVKDSELCVGCRDITGGYNLLLCEHCAHCSDSVFLAQCRSCRHCYACVNLLNQEYCWFNEPLGAQEWTRRRADLDLGDAEVLEAERSRFVRFKAGQPLRCVQGVNYENSSGNFLNEVKDCRQCCMASESEALEHCIWMNRARFSLFTAGFGHNSELLYGCSGVGNAAYNLKFSAQCRAGVRDLEYCYLAESNTHDCFGCLSLRNASHCILNKQYTPQEYAELLPRVKAHMRATGEYGEFFPPRLCPFAYNQTDAVFFFPLERDAAIARGYRWADLPQEAGDDRAELPRHVSLQASE